MMTGRQAAAWLKWPGAIVATLTAATLLGAFGGGMLDVFRTPARVDAVEVEVRGHHDTIQTMLPMVQSADSVLGEVHTESHEIQEQLVLIRLSLCGLTGKTVMQCIEEASSQ